jgi:hypothetical protein
MTQLLTEGFADLSSAFTIANIEKTPLTIDQLKPLIENQLEKIGPKEKRVFWLETFYIMFDTKLRYSKRGVEDKCLSVWTT